LGFYQPFKIIKDAQRHGLKVLPVDVTRSNWECTIESEGVGCRGLGVESKRVVMHSVWDGEGEIVNNEGDFVDSKHLHPTPNTQHPFSLRLGLLCVKGLRGEAGRAIVSARAQRPFTSIDDLHYRVPELRKDELRKLAAVGALNFIEQGVGCRGLDVEKNSVSAINANEVTSRRELGVGCRGLGVENNSVFTINANEATSAPLRENFFCLSDVASAA